MMFDQYQQAQQVWRYSAPTNIYTEDEWLTDDGWTLAIGYEDVSTSGGIHKDDFFRESTANIDINMYVSGATDILLCGELETNEFVPLHSISVTSGGTYDITHTISGMTFYTGLGIIFSTSVSGYVNWVYVGDKTYATQDDEFIDGMWKYMWDITGRIEPVSNSYQSYRNNQTFPDITEIDFIPLTYKNSVKPSDIIIDLDGVQRQIVGQPEIYPYMNKHVVLNLRRTQWGTPE